MADETRVDGPDQGGLDQGGRGSAAGHGRRSETAGQVFWMVAVLFGVLALVAGFFALNRPERSLPERVDYQSVVDLVSEQYPYDVLAPSSVPEEWRATSVDHAQDATGNRWRVGFLVDGSQYIGLEQSDGEVQSYLRDRLEGFEEVGRGGSWQRWLRTGEDTRRALVHADDGVVTIVRGTPSYEVLEEFAASLE